MIKSLRFDFSDSPWSTEVFNGRAPKFLKVNLEFMPIHDIPLGLDHNGFMTAPAYNVGRQMRPFGYDTLADIANGEQRFNKARRGLT